MIHWVTLDGYHTWKVCFSTGKLNEELAAKIARSSLRDIDQHMIASYFKVHNGKWNRYISVGFTHQEIK